MMKKEDIEKYIATLSPELQEKARACKNMDELKKFVAENDIELPEATLGTVAGGDRYEYRYEKYPKGTPMNYSCTECNRQLRYLDDIEDYPATMTRMYCDNPNCAACQNKWRFAYIRTYKNDGNFREYFQKI